MTNTVGKEVGQHRSLEGEKADTGREDPLVQLLRPASVLDIHHASNRVANTGACKERIQVPKLEDRQHLELGYVALGVLDPEAPWVRVVR